MKTLNPIIKGIVSLFRNLLRTHSTDSPIVILSFKFLGDTVFTIPAIQKIVDLNPERKIIICCYSDNMEIYKLYFDSLEFKTFSKEDMKFENRKINLDFIKATFEVRNLKPALTFDMTSCWKSALMSILIGSNSQIGFGNHFLSVFFDVFVSEKPKSQLEMFLNPVNKYYKNDDETNLRFSESINSDFSICIIPFAGWQAKEWNLRKFIELGELLADRYETKIVFESGRIAPEIISEINNKAVKFVPTKNINELINEIRTVSLIVTNDTGPLYIGYLMGKYCVGLFGPTNPDFHLFDPVRQYSIQKKIACTPGFGEKLCFTFGGRIGCPSNECMKLLEVREVFEEIIPYISKIRSRTVSTNFD